MSLLKQWLDRRNRRDRWIDETERKVKKCRRCIKGKPCKRHKTAVKRGLIAHRRSLIDDRYLTGEDIDNYINDSY